MCSQRYPANGKELTLFPYVLPHFGGFPLLLDLCRLLGWQDIVHSELVLWKLLEHQVGLNELLLYSLRSSASVLTAALPPSCFSFHCAM